MNERKKQKLNDYAILRAAKIPLHQISATLSLAPITLGRWYMETEFVHKVPRIRRCIPPEEM